MANDGGAWGDLSSSGIPHCRLPVAGSLFFPAMPVARPAFPVASFPVRGAKNSAQAVNPESGPLHAAASPKVFSSGNPIACMIDTSRSLWPLLNSR